MSAGRIRIRGTIFFSWSLQLWLKNSAWALIPSFLFLRLLLRTSPNEKTGNWMREVKKIKSEAHSELNFDSERIYFNRNLGMSWRSMLDPRNLWRVCLLRKSTVSISAVLIDLGCESSGGEYSKLNHSLNHDAVSVKLVHVIPLLVEEFFR